MALIALENEPLWQWTAVRARAQALIGKFNPHHEPAGSPAGGQFAPGEGDRKHPGAGYSPHAWEDKDGVIHTSNVYDAQRALFENRKVQLKQIKQISTLIRRLGETAAEMAEQGEAAPVFNLCNVSVEGTNLFCSEQKGIPRAEMPVIPAKQTKKFIKYLKEQGYKVEKGNEYAANLRATQSEISGAKVATQMARIEKDGFYKRLVISNDDYILDGHHTWAGALGIDARDGDLHDDKMVRIARVDIGITKLLEEAEKWTGGKGKKPASEAPKQWAAVRARAQALIEEKGDTARTVPPPAGLASPGPAMQGLAATGRASPTEVVARSHGRAQMPIKPGKDETQSEWMSRCVPDMTGAHGGTKRPQDQAVAACLQMWRDKDKKQAKQSAPDPDDGESREDFMDRCVDQMTDADVDDDAALDACSIAWEERAAKRAVKLKHKTTAEPIKEGREFILSDETVDRMGDIISSGGWDLVHFQKNPVALFNHRSDFPIGKWANLRAEGSALRGHLELAPEGTSPRIDEIRKLVEAGILRAVSVGFRPIEHEPIDKNNPFTGMRFLKQELVETSLVSVPANPNALSTAKSLKISPATIDLVFAEPGKKDTKIERRGLPGEFAISQRKHGKGEQMSSPLSQRITESEGRLNGLRDELIEHLKNIDDTNVSDADLDKTNTLNDRITQEEKTRTVLLASERNIAPTGTESAARSTTVVRSAGRPFTLPVKKTDSLDYVIRAGVVQAFAHHERISLEQARQAIARNFPYYDDEATKTFIDYVAKAATAPAITTVVGWAAELVQTIYADFQELLMPKSVFPRLSNLGLSLQFGRAGKVSIPTRSRTPTVAGSFVGEGQPIPVRQAAFTAQILTPKKMAVITSWTREMNDQSVPAIEGLLRNAIQEDTAVALDSVLLDANPATVVRPPGILNNVVPLTPTAGGGFAALVGDIKQLTGALLTATQGHIRSMTWLMNPQQVLSIGLTAAPGVGAFPFKDEISQGRLMSYPVIDSATVPMGTVIVLDAADFVTVGGEAPRFEISDQATLHYDDTTPLQISTVGSPNVVAAPVRSLWQTDSLALRLILQMNWALRRPTVATVSGVTW